MTVLCDKCEVLPYTELPAGLIDEGETPEQAAIRELEEETVRF